MDDLIGNIMDLLRGRMKSLPKKKSKIVSIFLSSKFSGTSKIDLHEEKF
jgi:hypothetical protein